MKVVLAGPYPDGVLEAFQKLLSSKHFQVESVVTEDAYSKITDAACIILRVLKAPREVIERNPNLKLICRWGVGYDSVDIKAAGEHGVLVTNTPGANAHAVSELAVMLMLAVGRNLRAHMQSIQNGIWSKSMFTDTSVTLYNKTVGLIGAGNIGKQVAKKVQAHGAKVCYYDPYRLSETQEQELGMTYLDFKSLLASSDIVSLHIPLTDESYHIISEKEFAQIKKGAILINTARGGLVDEQALARALAAKHLGGAGLDCVETEPLSPEHPLVLDTNVIVTPHIGGSTSDIAEIMVPMISDLILRMDGGQDVPYVVNRQYLR